MSEEFTNSDVAREVDALHGFKDWREKYLWLRKQGITFYWRGKDSKWRRLRSASFDLDEESYQIAPIEVAKAEALLAERNNACGHDIFIPECPDCRRQKYDQEDSQIKELSRLRAENESLRKDAERYRWLRGGPDVPPGSKRWAQWELRYWKGYWDTPFTDELDAAIDAAMRENYLVKSKNYIEAPCVVCGKNTVLACSDCAIDSGGKKTTHVCNAPSCRHTHEAIHSKKEKP